MKLYTIVYHPRNYRGLARMLAVALQWEEVTTRLDKPPPGPFKDEGYLVRDAYFYQRARAGGQLSFRKFAKEMVKKSTTALNNWADGKTRMRSDSERRLRALASPAHAQRPRNGTEVHVAPLDPANGRPYDSLAGGNTRGAAVPSAEGLYIAALLDRIEDDGVRRKAMGEAIEAIERFLHAGAGKRTGPSPGKS